MREEGTMRGKDAMRAFIRLPTDAMRAFIRLPTDAKASSGQREWKRVRASSGQREWKGVRAAVLALSSRPLMYVSREP